MKTKIFIRKSVVEADVVVDVTSNDLDDQLSKELTRYINENKSTTINSVLIAVTKVKPANDMPPLMSAAFWFSSETLIIGDVGNLLFGGILETPITGSQVMVGQTPLSNHVILWKRGSYANIFDNQMDYMYRELLCNYFRTLIDGIASPVLTQLTVNQ